MTEYLYPPSILLLEGSPVERESRDDSARPRQLTRLSSWLNDQGIENKIEVKAAAEQPCIACTIFSVNQEKIDATLARREQKTRDKLEMARAAKNRG